MEAYILACSKAKDEENIAGYEVQIAGLAGNPKPVTFNNRKSVILIKESKPIP